MEHLRPETETDRLLAALCYFLAPIVGLALYLTSARTNAYLRYHAQQSIVLGIGLIVLYTVTMPVFFLCLPVLIPLAVHLYYTYKGYTTPVFTIPVVTDLTKRFFPDFPG